MNLLIILLKNEISNDFSLSFSFYLLRKVSQAYVYDTKLFTTSYTSLTNLFLQNIIMYVL